MSKTYLLYPDYVKILARLCVYVWLSVWICVSANLCAPLWH